MADFPLSSYKFQIGDMVEFVWSDNEGDVNYEFLDRIGNHYRIADVDTSANDNNSFSYPYQLTGWGAIRHRKEELQLVKRAESTKDRPFKVGDRVKLKDYEKYGDHRSHRDQIATISMAVDEDNDMYITWPDKAGSYLFASDNHSGAYLVDENEDRPFKVGDKVVILEKSKYKSSGFYPGWDDADPKTFTGKTGYIGKINFGSQYSVWPKTEGWNELCGGTNDLKYYGVFEAKELRHDDYDDRMKAAVGIAREAATEELQSNKENEPMKKLYRSTQDTSFLEAGAILEKYGSSYAPVEAIWDTEVGAMQREKHGELTVNAISVENDKERYEEIYEDKLGKVKYLTKDAAKAAYSAIFKAAKK